VYLAGGASSLPALAGGDAIAVGISDDAVNQLLSSLWGAGAFALNEITQNVSAFIADAKQVAPEKPFFFYLSPGACHAPHHAPQEWIDKYRGKFDMGFERYYERRYPDAAASLGRRAGYRVSPT